MKNRNDFVSNSSSCSYVIPIDKENHDKTKWLKNTLRIYPDTNKILMDFDDFSHGGTWNEGVSDNWKFVCSQLMHWKCYDLIFDGTLKSRKKILRDLYNSEEFEQLNTAVIEYFKELGIEMNGVELDEEDILVHNEKDEDGYECLPRCTLRQDCSLDHDSVYNSWEHLLKDSGCSSIAELIWGVNEIKISWS